MANPQFIRPLRLFLFSAALLMIAAMACGTSAPEAPPAPEAASGSQQASSQQSSSQPSTSQDTSSQQQASSEQSQSSAQDSAPAPTKVLAAATATPLPPAIQAEPSADATEGLVDFDIKDPVIDPDRSRQSEGEMVLAYHTALSPKWLDPQVAPASRTPYSAFLQAVFDPLIGAMPNGRFVYLLAEDLEMTDDFKKATFRLREGITFHNGEPVTTEDVKFSYENYSGANADIYQDKTERIEIVDERTITFYFNEAFIDFLELYGSEASGAGFIVPKAYYQEVGPEKFIEAPIGTGAYKIVGQTTGQAVIMEAYEDYWRKVPNIKTIETKGVPELASRVAALKTGEVDVAYFVTGALLQDAIEDPNIQVDPNNSAPFWLFFPGYEDPANPFFDKRVREAVSLAMDREFLSATETQGLAIPTGNFIPPGKGDYLDRPVPEYNVERAKQLMAEAGYAEGFELDAFTPFPPVFSLAERIMDSLREIGIKSELNVTQRPVFLSMLREHRAGFPGTQIAFSISTGPPNAAGYFRAFGLCEQGSSVICDDNIDAKMAEYESSLDLEERSSIVEELQAYILDEHIFVPVYINAFAMGAGPKIKGDISQYSEVSTSLFPYEDIEINP
ncbi:MAG: ABC transporter substrate-binding protein [Chloroflexi bacterium]|nr:ABC transporter substrate-binding protein [Chloroflexota bacterium]